MADTIRDNAGSGGNDAAGADISVLTSLYDSAGRLEIELERSVRDPLFTLTAGQVGAFNQILTDARRAVPGSIALRDDVAEIRDMADARPADLYHALHTTIVPTLHNALPPDRHHQRG